MKENYSYQEAEQHYNGLVYSVLGVGVALSLFIISKEDINYYFLSYGYLTLFVSTLLIESFSQKVLSFRNEKIKLKINKLPYLRCQWLVELLILSPIFIYYINLFYYSQFPFLFIISILLYVLVIINWLMRLKYFR